MTTSTLLFAVLVWVSLVGLAVAWMKQPKRRKTSDELETGIAANRSRILDLEDRLEHFVKREAMRVSREKRDPTQGVLPQGVLPMPGDLGSDRGARLAALRAEHAKRVMGGTV